VFTEADYRRLKRHPDHPCANTSGDRQPDFWHDQLAVSGYAVGVVKPPAGEVKRISGGEALGADPSELTRFPF